ncbi:LamG-like jellyroll fold domain-containing protein [Micromonospora purpureochromogenes]|uniref:LamG-like jellyroll fold domain-containing protein n=1 Tax=Micromonospora purpureochromogenes TaxID=47872 RepID=UPI0036341B3D
MLALTLVAAAPRDPLPDRGRSDFPLSWLWSALTTRMSWAADPAVPRQQSGRKAPSGHYERTGAVRAVESGERAKGELARHRPHRPTSGVRVAGGDQRGFDSRTSRRVASAASEKSDVYRNADGTFTRRVHQRTVNYRAKDGSWQPVDGTLKRRADDRWVATASPLDVSFAGAPTPAAPLVDLAVGNGRRIGYDLAGASLGAPVVDGELITYNRVFPNVDLRLVTTGTDVKESLVLHSAEVPTEYVYPLRLAGLTPRVEADGSVAFRAADGSVPVRMPAAYLEDSSVDVSGAPAMSRGVRYEIVATADGPALRMSVDGTWLRDKARKFPVILDPTMATTASDTYVQSGATEVDRSTEGSVAVGTFDGGTGKARSLLPFPSFGTTYAGKKVSTAKLNLFLTYQGINTGCEVHRFDVYAARSTWSATGVRWATYPTLSASIGNASPTSTAACGNQAGTRNVGTWVPVTLDVAALNDWVTGGTNYGLALKAVSETNSKAWKRFTSVDATTASPTMRCTHPTYGSIRCDPFLDITYTDNVAPQVDVRYPADNYTVNTLTPELAAQGHDPDNWPNKGLRYSFVVKNSAGTQVASSGWVASGVWRVPAGILAWGQTYQYTVQVNDYSTTGPAAPVATAFTTQVPQPGITADLAQNGGKGYEPSIGNYTTSETDAEVATVGPPLVISRDYNSRDTRADSAFAQGWSSALDMQVREQPDAAGVLQTVAVRYPSGEEVAFGRNSNGTFASPLGRYSVFKTMTGGYSLTDKDATSYEFTRSVGSGIYRITRIVDASGRSSTFRYDAAGRVDQLTSDASGRKLSLTWATPAGAAHPHVATVTTDPVDPANPASALTWTYRYEKDLLTQVCAPGESVDCTRYDYTRASQHAATTLNAGPYSYWRLGEAAGATSAMSQVLSNDGADNATYNNVTLGGSGPLADSTATSAAFNGTSSSVQLRQKLMTEGSYQSISMWFRTTTAGGVLFSYQDDVVAPGATTAKAYVPALYVGTDGRLHGQFYTGNSAAAMASAKVVNDGNWHHVALSGNGGSQTMYLDGAQTASLTGAINMTFTGMPNVYVGAGFLGGGWPSQPNTTGTASFFNGSIADVALYNQALTANTVAGLHASGANGTDQLSKITSEAGRVLATVEYDKVSGRVGKVTDENGGTWQIGVPEGIGSSQGYVAAVLGSRPQNYWRLGDIDAPTDAVNEVDGYAMQYRNVTFDTTQPNLTSPFADRYGAVFNGTSSHLFANHPGVAPIEADGAVELWFRVPAGTTKSGVLYAYQNDPIEAAPRDGPASTPALYVGSDGFLRGSFTSFTSFVPMTSTVKVNDGKWHHVVLNGSFLKQQQSLFLDNKLIGLKAEAAQKIGGNAYIGVGTTKSWPGSSSDVSYFTGNIAEVAYYTHTLTAAQVDAHYQASVAVGSPTATTTGPTLTPVSKVSVTDPTGKATTQYFDLVNGNRLIASTDVLGNTTSYGYDVGGFASVEFDPMGQLTESGKDVRGNTIRTTTCGRPPSAEPTDDCDTTYYTYWPDATTVNLTPDARNDQILDIRDARSRSATDERYRTTFAYDTAGNRTSMTSPPVAGYPNGRTVAMTYTTAATPAVGGGTTPPGLPLSTTSATGARQTTEYNAAGDVVRITDAAGLVTEYGYDGLGRATTQKIISDSYPAGLVTSYVYDGDGQVSESTEPAVTNRVTGAVHTLRTVDSYDADGNVLTRTQTDLTGGDSPRSTRNSYNGRGQLVKSVDPADTVTVYEYDVYGNQVKEVVCDSEPAPSAPCPAGDVLRMVESAYDAQGQLLTNTLTGRDGTKTTLVSNVWFANGDLAAETDAMNWTTRYEYYSDGKLKKVSRTDGVKTVVLEENTYDRAGNVAVKKENNGATTTSYLYDPASRLVASTVSPGGVDRISTYSYDGDDRVTATRTLAGAGRTVLQTNRTSYDPMGRVLSTSVGKSAASGPNGWWKLDETTVDDNAGYLAWRPAVSYDSSPSNNDLTFVVRNGATVGGGQATFTANELMVANQAVDTTQSYSVSAWVKPSNFTTSQIALGQGGTANAAFSLQYNKTLNKWAFSAPSSDAATPSTTYSATSSTALTANTWVHLVGVYDAGTKAMSLHVNNVAGTGATNPTPFASKKGFTIGGVAYANGSASGGFLGGVDNVQVYQRTLTAAEISSLYAAGNGRTAAALWTNELTTVNTLDKRGLPTAVRDPRGNVTNHEYDEAGELAQTVAPSVTTETFGSAPIAARPVARIGYNAFGEQVEQQDPLGNITQTRVDALGRPWQTIVPNYTPPGGVEIVGASMTTRFDKLGQVESSTDPLDRTTSFEYDSLGNTTKVTGPTGKAVTASYDKLGDLLESVDATGARSAATYDLLGRRLTSSQVVRQPSPVTNTTTYDYGTDAYGSGPWLRKTTSPEGVTTSNAYNSLGEVTGVTDGANYTTQLEYDGLGRVVKTTAPDSTKTVTVYDAAGRQVEERKLDAANAVLTTRSVGYDDNGNRTSATDARRTTVTFSYDALGRLTGQSEPVTSTKSISSSFGYDAAGNPTRFTDGRGNQFWTTYNSWGLPESQIEPSTTAYPAVADRTFTATYDAAGQLKEQIAPGGVRITNRYDDLGRMISQAGTGAEAATAERTFEYDDAGRITSLSVPSGTNTITYDDRGLPLSISGPGDNLSYSYNRDGRVASRADAAGTTAFGYDTAGRFRTASNATTGINLTIGYNSMSQVATVTYGSGNVRSLTYDPLHRLKTDTLKNAAGTTTLGSITYGYDDNDNETSKVLTGFAGGKSNTYSYDLANRLTSWNDGTTSVAYAYDDSGNRTQAGTRTFSFDARNQLLSSSDGTAYTYTARGTLKQTGAGALAFDTVSDAFGQVISQEATGGVSTYEYDAVGRAVRPGFRYSGLGNDLAQDGASTYTRGPGGELLGAGAGTGAGSVYTWLDQHDDVVGQFTANGTTLTGSSTYDPLGRVLASNGLVGSLGYQSEWTDTTTGRVNMLARWYNPDTGQFDSRDTVANNAVPESIDANRFQYGEGNPLTTTDPTGHWGLSDLKKAVKSTVRVVTNPVAAIQTTYRVATATYHQATKAYNYVASGRAWKDVKRTTKAVVHKAKRAVKVVKDTTVRWAKKKAHAVRDAYNSAKKCLSGGVKKCAKETAKKAVKNAVKSVKSTVAAIKKDPWKFVAQAAVAVAATVAVGALCATGVGCLIVAGAVAGAMSAGAGYMVDVAQGEEKFTWSGLASTMIEGGLDGGLSAGMSRFTGGLTKMAGGAAASKIPGLGARRPGGAAKASEGPSAPAGYQGRHRASSGCTRPHSFDPTTKVLMADGTSRAIQDLGPGDKVAATDPEKGGAEGRPVTAVHVNQDRELTNVTVRDATSGKKSVLKTTQHHPFWDATDRKWADAAELTVGHRLLVHDDKRLEGDGTGAGMGGGGPGAEVVVVKVDNFTGDREMRDLTVAELHTYYVLAGDEPVLVHNNDGCEVFYRGMGEKEYKKLGPNGEITPRGENFVTQARDYVVGLRDRFRRRGGRNAEIYTRLVRYEMQPGTTDALIAAGRGSGDNMAAIRENFGIDLEEIGDSQNFVHVKQEREGLNFGLRSGSADVFNSRIISSREVPWEADD